jgi:RNA polymerase sigma-70 factor (ECF subfamily)
MLPPTAPDQGLTLFLEQRPRLFGLAYRMLGCRTEAEDVLQEAYLRWHRQEVAHIDSPEAWLTTTVSRLCIDCLRAHRQRRDYIGTWLPQPLSEAEMSYTCPSQVGVLFESLSMAFLLLLEQLNPVERAVFLLKEIFECSYREIAEVVQKTPDCCRQIAHRARIRIEPDRPRTASADPGHQQQLLMALMMCVTTNDLNGLLHLLAEDVVLIADGGGKVRSVLRPLRGVERLRHFFTAIKKRLHGTPISASALRVNGQPALLMSTAQERSLLVIENRGDQITRILILRNPDKLPQVQ